MEIIVPAAGLSTRFPNMKPKYILESNDGNLMIEKSVKPYIKNYNITIGILKNHEDKYQIKKILTDKFSNKINIIVLNRETNGPAETVYQILNHSNIKLNDEIFIKDCDSFFNHVDTVGNYICVTKSSELIKNLKSKSFTVSDDLGFVSKIQEKKVVSNKFSVGGYKFSSGHLFTNAYEKIKEKKSEIFVSDIINICIEEGIIFKENYVENYIDVGTLEEWSQYNSL
jgi:hypothetical protein